MSTGVGTPLTDKVLAGALSKKDGAVNASGKDSAPSKQVSSSGGFHEQADQVDLSSTARARLRNDHPHSKQLPNGRGELAAQDVTDQLKQVGKKLSQLRNIVREAAPAEGEGLVKQLESVGNTLEHINRQLQEKAGPEPVLKDLNETAKSFKELVEEFQAHFEDEERIPPSIYNQIRHLLEKSLADGPPVTDHIDALA